MLHMLMQYVQLSRQTVASLQPLHANIVMHQGSNMYGATAANGSRVTTHVREPCLLRDP